MWTTYGPRDLRFKHVHDCGAYIKCRGHGIHCASERVCQFVVVMVDGTTYECARSTTDEATFFLLSTSDNLQRSHPLGSRLPNQATRFKRGQSASCRPARRRVSAKGLVTLSARELRFKHVHDCGTYERRAHGIHECLWWC